MNIFVVFVGLRLSMKVSDNWIEYGEAAESF
jgi:hypothetical protein